MSADFPDEYNLYWNRIKQAYPKADSYALTVGSVLCAIGHNLREGDALAGALIGKLQNDNPERWDEARQVFERYFKIKLKRPEDLYAFIDRVSKPIPANP